jgi:single-strand DNA-binding protein
MFDTPVTIVGNVLTAPEWRRTANTGTPLVTFRVASTSRRFDKERAAWVDGDSLRVRVTCWRRLAENLSLSVQLGDPVIVYGRMFTRDWTDEEGGRHTSYELDATAVGHDLGKGLAKFGRRKAAATTDMVNDEASAATVGGELTEAMEDPERPGDLPPTEDLFEEFNEEFNETGLAEEPVLAGAGVGGGTGTGSRLAGGA